LTPMPHTQTHTQRPRDTKQFHQLHPFHTFRREPQLFYPPKDRESTAFNENELRFVSVCDSF
jgi:hypothetical protein